MQEGKVNAPWVLGTRAGSHAKSARMMVSGARSGGIRKVGGGREPISRRWVIEHDGVDMVCGVFVTQ